MITKGLFLNTINFYWIIFDLLLLAPNIVFAATHKDGFENLFHNRLVETLEQIGRFGCFAFMFFSPRSVCRGFVSDTAKTAYLAVSSVLVAMYLLGWLIFWKEDSVRKSLVLSILPSLLFLESGILTRNFVLIGLSVVFAPCHIIISYMNSKLKLKNDK